jgi:hypothetical protein
MDREAIRGVPILRLDPADEETITTYRCNMYDEALKSIRAAPGK